MKVGDVFRFRWNEAERARRVMPDHCFDGQLIATDVRGKLMLVDTYWGSLADNNYFTPEEAERMGTLSFVCNLNDTEPAPPEAWRYYNDSDLFNLSYQHGCYERIRIRKGATRSKAKMLESLASSIEYAQRESRHAEEKEKRLRETFAKVEAGDLSVYIF